MIQIVSYNAFSELEEQGAIKAVNAWLAEGYAVYNIYATANRLIVMLIKPLTPID